MIEDNDEWKSPYLEDNINESSNETHDLNFEEYRLSTFNLWPVSLTFPRGNPFLFSLQRLIIFFVDYLTAQITSRHITFSWLWIFVSYG